MFRVLVGLRDIGASEKFTDAFRMFWEAVKRMVNGGTSMQMLETSNFLVYEKADGGKIPMTFYEARDFAYDLGLLAGHGELQNIEEPSLNAIEAGFIAVHGEHVADAVEECVATVAKALRAQEGLAMALEGGTAL